MQIYLDNAATTRVCDEAAKKALDIMTVAYGNPSSAHRAGREAKKELDNARAKVTNALGASPDEIFFTSGGTESDNWAIIKGAEITVRYGKHVITSLAEHDAVRRSADELEKRGFKVTRLRPDGTGAVSLEAFRAALRPDTSFVSLMLVNNETGAVTDIAGISAILKANNPHALLHTDAVQGFLKERFTPAMLGADLVSVSGHKIHAPKGVGALYIRRGVRITPLLVGGGQESGQRSGTEGLPQIAALGAACELGQKKMAAALEKMRSLRERAVSRLTTENPGLLVIGGGAPHILSISMPGYRSEVLINFLESRNIFVSKSSACKRGRRSHVLESMGLKNDIIDGAIRVGLSRYTTEKEIDIFCDCLGEARRSLVTALR